MSVETFGFKVGKEVASNQKGNLLMENANTTFMWQYKLMFTRKLNMGTSNIKI